MMIAHNAPQNEYRILKQSIGCFLSGGLFSKTTPESNERYLLEVCIPLYKARLWAETPVEKHNDPETLYYLPHKDDHGLVQFLIDNFSKELIDLKWPKPNRGNDNKSFTLPDKDYIEKRNKFLEFLYARLIPFC